MDLNNNQFYPVISKSEARGNSRPVSHSEFQQLAAAGHRYVQKTQQKPSTEGLDQDWEGIKNRAYELTREPWGGATVNSHTGHIIGDTSEEVAAKNAGKGGRGNSGYGITVKNPGQDSISVSPKAGRGEFHKAMDEARERFPQIANKGGHIGAFHDADEGRIDIDPIQVVRTKNQVEQVGAYTRAVGGAYHFKSGNGYFPPHVKE